MHRDKVRTILQMLSNELYRIWLRTRHRGIVIDFVDSFRQSQIKPRKMGEVLVDPRPYTNLEICVDQKLWTTPFPYLLRIYVVYGRALYLKQSWLLGRLAGRFYQTIAGSSLLCTVPASFSLTISYTSETGSIG